MPVLALRDKRFIAIKYQEAGWTDKQLRAHGYSARGIRKWRSVDCFGPDSSFADAPRSGRKRLFSETQAREMVKTELETDVGGAVELAADKHNCSVRTIQRTAHRVGELVKPISRVVLDDGCRNLRVEFAEVRLRADHLHTCWVDHTCLPIPPEPLTSVVWRLRDSTKPVPKRPRYKFRTSMQMYLAAGACGFSEPTFSGKEVPRKKRRRAGDAELGTRWVTESVDEDSVAADLHDVVLPFMRANGLTILDMDNASVQTCQRRLLTEEKIESTGFASRRLKDPDKGGHPPNSPDLMLLDATVFSNFKREWRRECPMTIEEGITTAKRILANMDGPRICARYIEHFDLLLDEVIENEGGHTHHLKS